MALITDENPLSARNRRRDRPTAHDAHAVASAGRLVVGRTKSTRRRPLRTPPRPRSPNGLAQKMAHTHRPPSNRPGNPRRRTPRIPAAVVPRPRHIMDLPVRPPSRTAATLPTTAPRLPLPPPFDRIIIDRTPPTVIGRHHRHTPLIPGDRRDARNTRTHTFIARRPKIITTPPNGALYGRPNVIIVCLFTSCTDK